MYCVFSIIQLCLLLLRNKSFIIDERFGRLENYRLHRSHFFVLAKTNDLDLISCLPCIDDTRTSFYSTVLLQYKGVFPLCFRI